MTKPLLAPAHSEPCQPPDTVGCQPSTPLLTPSALQNQPVLILGLGSSGLAMARWCAHCGAQVTVADSRSAPPQLTPLMRDVPQARFLGGVFDGTLIHAGLYAVFISPGLTPVQTAPISAAASALGICAFGELALFYQALQALQRQRAYSPRVLAISGTNGKTTVTSLTGQLVLRCGHTVAVAGNIGPTLLDTLMQRLAEDTLPDIWVLELSSFQLDGVHGFEPSAATVLNISQDHLDWHGSMQAYIRAKATIFGQKSLMLLNRDDPLVMGMLGITHVGERATPLAAALAPTGKTAPGRSSRKAVLARRYLTFGAGLPQRPGDFGIETVNGMTWLVRALEADASIKLRKDETAPLHLQRLMPADALRIRGRHNAVNALAALALASAAGCALGPMLYGLREYRGEPHRVELIGNVNGIEYFDDSKGTNVGATAAALHGLGAERKVVVILGGDGKGQDFSPLVEPVRRFARAVVLIGRDAALIRAALSDTSVALHDAQDMQAAVNLAAAQARSGDAVLMSPACASFDMFDNYEHRARVFVQSVQALAADAGVLLEGNL